MPIVVVAAGYAAYQYYENKRQNSQLNLAAGDGGGETETEKDASKAAPAPAAGAAAVSAANEEARDDEHGDAADKEPHDGHGDDDKTEESSSGSLDDDESSGCESSSSSAPAAGAAEGDGANAPAKPPPTPTLLQQWNEKYPGQQQQKGQRRNRWSARLRRNFDGWRSASAPPQPPPSSASSSSSSDPSSSTAGAGKTATAPASGGATGSVYSEVREALAIRDSSQEEETKEDNEPGDCPPDLPTPAPASASRTETKQGPLNALRRNLTEWRTPAPKGSVYPEAWEALGFRDSSQDEEKKIAMEPGDCPPEPLTPASAPATQSEPKMGPLGALRRNFTEWRTPPPEGGVYPEAWDALGFRDSSQVEKQEKDSEDCPPPAKLPTPALATQSETKLSRLEALRRNFFERRTTPPENGSYPEVWTALGFRDSSQEEEEEEKEKFGDCPPAEVPTPAPATQSETQPGPPTATKADPKAGPLAALRRSFCEWRAPSSSSLRPESGAAAPGAGKGDECAGAGAGVEEGRPGPSTGGDACYDEVWDCLVGDGGASRSAQLPPTSDIAPTAGNDVGVGEPLTAQSNVGEGVYAEVWGVLFDHCGTSSEELVLL